MTETKYEHIWNEFTSTLNIKKKYRRLYVENEEGFVEFFWSKIPDKLYDMAENAPLGRDANKEFWRKFGEDGIVFWLWHRMARSLVNCSVPFVIKYYRDTFEDIVSDYEFYKQRF